VLGFRFTVLGFRFKDCVGGVSHCGLEKFRVLIHGWKYCAVIGLEDPIA
jgi:hypothetical protein